MKKIALLFILLVSTISVVAQDKIEQELKNLTDTNQHQKIIDLHSKKHANYNAKSLFYIGQAYYINEDDNNCIKFMDLSIQKGPKDPGPHYIKASTLNYMKKYDEAIKSFREAISLNPNDPNFYNGIGDSYYNLKKHDLALESYKKATELENCPDRPYAMIVQIYSDQNNTKKALEASYVTKSKVTKGSNSYINALFNIGLLESLTENYDNAEQAFLELIKIDTSDFHSFAKLIQIYYHKREYDKAKPYKDHLYQASKRGLLKDNLEDMFCFDQFKWNGKLIQAFERYEEGNKPNIYNKHLFYVVNENNKIEYRIQTEYSPIAVELGEFKYMLCATKDGTHINSGLGFNDNFNYDDLKKAVIYMLEKNK